MPKIRFLMKSVDECKKIATCKDMYYTTRDREIYGIYISDFKFISEKAEAIGVDVVEIINRNGDNVMKCSVLFNNSYHSVYVFVPIDFVDKFFDIKELTTYFPHLVNLI